MAVVEKAPGTWQIWIRTFPLAIAYIPSIGNSKDVSQPPNGGDNNDARHCNLTMCAPAAIAHFPLYDPSALSLLTSAAFVLLPTILNSSFSLLQKEFYRKRCHI